MVCGYQESKYLVEQAFKVQVGALTRHMELRTNTSIPDPHLEQYIASLPPERRQPPEDVMSKRYISLIGTSAEGAGYDVLLLYKQQSEGKLDADWERLTQEPSVKLDELQGWYEKVLWHGTGYTRDGGICMY
jgi:hypothetical protein